jgi:hypothetical protein
MIVTISVEESLDVNLISAIEEDLDNGIIYRVKYPDLSFVTFRTKDDYRKFLNELTDD